MHLPKYYNVEPYITNVAFGEQIYRIVKTTT